MNANAYDKAREVLGLHDKEHERLQGVRRLVDRIETVTRYFDQRAAYVNVTQQYLGLRIDLMGSTYCINLDERDPQERAALEQWLRKLSEGALLRLSGPGMEVSP